jgi:hypothetical protein
MIERNTRVINAARVRLNTPQHDEAVADMLLRLLESQNEQSALLGEVLRKLNRGQVAI